MVENFELKPNGLVITWKKPFGVPNGFFFYSCGALRRIRLSTHTKYSHPCGVRYFVEMPEIESGSNERRTAHLRSVVRFEVSEQCVRSERDRTIPELLVFTGAVKRPRPCSSML